LKLEEFARNVELVRRSELDRVRLLAFFHHKVCNKKEFGKNDIVEWFGQLHFPRPNTTRLLRRIRGSRQFVRGSTNGEFKLHALTLDELQAELPGLRAESEDVVSTDTILPYSIYESTRGFIESLAKQINASYEYNIFDGCAVLMRRLLEVLLILTYEHLGVESAIQDSSGNYVPLEKIIANAKSSTHLKLSRDSKAVLEEFRQIGNFSAHKIYYNCRRADLTRIATSYRATIEELLYKAGIRV
jgi:hypothetical protein